MRRGLLPLNAHAMLEPLIGAVLIASPWIFGFSDVNDAKVVSIAVGVVILIAGALTDWRVSLARVIPLRVHLITDLALAAVLVLAPFVLGFADEGGATRFMVIAGVLEIAATLSTRWDPAEAAPSAVDRRSPSTLSH